MPLGQKKKKTEYRQRKQYDNKSQIKTLKMAHIKKIIIIKKKKKENLQESYLARLGHMPTVDQSPMQEKSQC